MYKLTISKYDYLRNCVRTREAIDTKDWWVKAFALPDLKDEDQTKLNTNDLCIKPDGLFVVNELSELVKIVDYKRGEPLFKIGETMMVDSSVMSNIQGEMEVLLTRLLINAIVVPKRLESKFPFMNPENGLIDVGYIESIIAPKVKNKDEEFFSDSITVKEMIEVINNLNFFELVAVLVNTAASPKAITKAKGVDKLTKQLLEEAGDEINDPVKLVEIETKIRAYDANYLKDDPVARNIMGKKSGVGRFKMYGLYGKGLDFVKDSKNDTLIKTSMSDGFDATPESIPKYFNDARYASFSRGDNTALAGTIYKELQRSLNSIIISPTACNTSRGLVKVFTKAEVNYSVGRFIKVDNKWKTINSIDEAKSLVGKTIEMRSPIHCKSPGDTICYACMSTRFKHTPNAVSNMAASISDVLLNMFLKLMHGIQTDVTEIEIDDLIN